MTSGINFGTVLDSSLQGSRIFGFASPHGRGDQNSAGSRLGKLLQALASAAARPGFG